jgi:hypothetical protein
MAPSSTKGIVMRRLIPVLLVCAWSAVSPGQEQKKIARISRAEMFSGDLKKLEPHLFFATGSVKIEPLGQQHFDCEVELWEKGKRIELPKAGFIVGRMLRQTQDPFECTISVKDTTVDGKPKFQITVAFAGFDPVSHPRFLIDNPEKEEWRIFTKRRMLPDPIDLKAGQSVVAWGLFMGGAGDNEVRGTIDQDAKRAPWALLMRVSDKTK